MKGDSVVTATNHNSGINGGITNGMPVVFRTAVKPTPSIYKEQETVDYIAKQDAPLSIQGRHEPLHRAAGRHRPDLRRRAGCGRSDDRPLRHRMDGAAHQLPQGGTVMEYGLIGSKLGHSYSKIIHEMLCGYHYDLCPLPTEEEARAFLTRRQFKAINVTIPYKRLVMEYCTYIDPRAKAIGAVNTVVNKNGLLYGYNTDHLGFAHLCDAHGVDFAGRTVLILGTGGTHNTTSAVARDKGAARVLTVSRTPDAAKGPALL